jgi:hypothetical protein
MIDRRRLHELPPDVSDAFAADLLAFHASLGAQRDKIAARQLIALREYIPGLRIADVKVMFFQLAGKL